MMIRELVPSGSGENDVLRGGSLSACCIIIPVLNPSSLLTGLVQDLSRAGFKHIVVIDDGSAEPFQSVFLALAQTGATVLKHVENWGKGAALKTGLGYAHAHGYAAAVTVDADGQHSPVDVVRIAESVLSKAAPACVLGVRSFGGEVPLRSKLGNRLTQKLFGALSSLSVSDTQTGLRGFSGDLLPRLGTIHGDRYEFEMEMLLWLARERIPVTELPIETIYLDNNAHSHFRPLLDSFRIYWVLFRDLFVAISSFGIDIVLFSVFFATSGSVLGSTYLARVVSGAYNFLGNRHFVFRTTENQRFLKEAMQYVGLAILVASISGVLVSSLFQLASLGVTLCKVLVDLSMYGVSFLVRRHYIFAVRKTDSG
jgi:glycosyltransferase involved in cell wall biosynthesis